MPKLNPNTWYCHSYCLPLLLWISTQSFLLQKTCSSWHTKLGQNTSCTKPGWYESAQLKRKSRLPHIKVKCCYNIKINNWKFSKWNLPLDIVCGMFRTNWISKAHGSLSSMGTSSFQICRLWKYEPISIIYKHYIR